ncbi:MAG: TIGR03118 family protein, partial [Acidobacteriota bacterium]|nr:TIGR03118 family protein [Acidobacteriota bacterium]
MHHRPAQTRVRKTASAALVTLLLFAFLPAPPTSRVAAQSAGGDTQNPAIPSPLPGTVYRQTNLISDIPGFAPVLDPLLVNPWGITETASSPFWVSNNRSSTTQLIRGDTGGAPVVLNASPQTITIPGTQPTGTVANTSTTDFVLPGPCASAPCVARFLFASLAGKITGWNPNAPAAGSTTAVVAADQSGGNKVYTGLALANNGTANFLYAADFKNGKIDVFDKNFNLQAAGFPFAKDATILAATGTYNPYNIQNLGGTLYVTYAKVGPSQSDPVEDGDGKGFVRRFDANGVRDTSFAIDNLPANHLNAPWGLAIAPTTFGTFGGALLVGNFGEGSPSINAFSLVSTPVKGAFLGSLNDESNNPIVIDELWALQFGNGGAGGDANTLYFSAGTSEEEHGLFGKLNPTTATATSLIQFATDNFAVDEAGGHVDFTVIRTGDTSGTATVNFNTFDESHAGHASQKSDYEISLGKITFNPGETSKTFRILIVNDNFVEGDETIDLALSNPTGTGVGLGEPNVAEVTILDNDTTPPTTNPIDDPSFFVRQHYLDFLNREPDTSGFNFWVNNITSCGADANCTAVKRVNTSAAFFLSIEFQQTGLLAYLANKAAFGASASGSPAPVLYGQFERDVQQLQRNFVFGQSGADAQLEANKQAYFADFVARPEFVAT